MKFDIAAKLVSPTQRAWVVHAGRGRVNFPDFIDNGIVYLEAPYLRLEDNIVKSKIKLRRAIRRSVEWRRHKETSGSQPPSQTLSDFGAETFQESDLQTLSGSVNRLYGEAQKGDLIIVPGREVYDGVSQPVIRFGEIFSDFNPVERYSGAHLSSQQVPIRKVKWLKTVPRKLITYGLEKRIGKPPAVREIKINRDSEELLKHAYQSYIFEGNSSSLVTADEYDAKDFLLLNHSSELIAFLVSAHAAISQGNNPAQINDIRTFTERYFRQASIENIQINFASPGHWRIVGATVSLAVFVSLGIAVFSSGLSSAQLKMGIQVKNSVSPADTTANDLQQSMNILLSSVDNLELKKATERAIRAKKEIGLQSSTKF